MKTDDVKYTEFYGRLRKKKIKKREGKKERKGETGRINNDDKNKQTKTCI